MKILIKVLALLSMTIFIVFHCVASEKDNIKKLVETFCSSEFNICTKASFDRDKLIKYTQERIDHPLDNIALNDYPYEFYLDSDPLIIVDQYKILDVKQIDEKHAYVLINYHQLAISKGAGNGINDPMSRKFITDVRYINVTLNIEYDGKRWWIIDPPYPKVSDDVILKYYSDEASDTYLYYTGEKGPPLRKSTPKEIARFKEVYDYEMGIVNFIKSLKN
jgi:hypothetical protein